MLRRLEGIGLRRFCIAKAASACRHSLLTMALGGLAAAAPAQAPPTSEPGPASAPRAAATTPAPQWIHGPRAWGRLQPADLGLVINTADPYSIEVGEHYIQRRGLQPAQVLRLALPTAAVLSVPEFEALQQAIGDHFGPTTQALALAWRAPYAVTCQSITGSLMLGHDPALCQNPCAASRPSPYFNSASWQPFSDHGLRPAMLLAARDADQAKAMIDRGAAADGTLARADRPAVNALFLTTPDAARNVRTVLFPPPGPVRWTGVDVSSLPAAVLNTTPRVLLALTGSVRVDLLPRPDWVPGALADHLTSFGGALQGTHGQGTVLDWIESGATASHGAVSEPCNHLQKFPHPQVLLLHYLQGATALEAYAKSVAWPQQSLFVGEPLAAPFAVLAAPPPATPSAAAAVDAAN
jgi:uncharacterized protein (TIGR03790 family)